MLFLLERSFSLIRGHGYPHCPIDVKIIVNFPFGKVLIFPKIIMGPYAIHQLESVIRQGRGLRVGRGCLCLPPVPPVPPGAFACSGASLRKSQKMDPAGDLI